MEQGERENRGRAVHIGAVKTEVGLVKHLELFMFLLRRIRWGSPGRSESMSAELTQEALILWTCIAATWISEASPKLNFKYYRRYC